MEFHMENIRKAMENLNRSMSEGNQTKLIPFEDFLKILTEKPANTARNVFQVFHDMIHYYVGEGIDEYPDDPESIKYSYYDCTKLFVEDVDHPFFADRLFANRLITHAEALKRGAQQNKIYIFDGPPGSGKTSLVQLIPRLYNAGSGKILMDGIDINLLDLDFLRQQTAFMPQESFLFSGTIRENILMGKDIDKKRLEQVIHACCLKKTLKEMKEGLDTVVGERGITLSGGQKQRIALARTLILDKPVIILDDPISQMDTGTAFKVISGISQMNHSSSFIIISHRISALSSCDIIYILKNGKIINSGTHEELIENDHFYRESFMIQQFESGEDKK
jgi:ABC-type multidrug transport system fused ATPase/permease subunit